MATTAQQIETLRQGSTLYALGCMGSTARQLSLLKVPFPKVMNAISLADSTITCVDCGDTLRKQSPSMKAQERLDEMVSDAFDYARENLIRAAREIRAMGGTLPQIQEFILAHINCPDKANGHGHDHEHAPIAVPGTVVIQ